MYPCCGAPENWDGLLATIKAPASEENQEHFGLKSAERIVFSMRTESGIV
jgi:hypothetical protein